MRFYQATQFLFPHSLERRILLICFGAVHVPLLACIVFQAATGAWNAPVLIVLLLATLASTGLGLWAVSSLLAPIARAIMLLGAVQEGRRIDAIPVGGDDVVGHLFRSVAQAANHTADRIDRLTDEAKRDPLTGLRNRRGFLDDAARALTDEYNAVLALIDLDHFKSINDVYGHAEGDRLLGAFAKRLEAGVRRSDITARWGGEEFAVLLNDATLDDARAVIERLRLNVSELDPIFAGNHTITFSCGLAPVRNHAFLGAATSRADAALYMAKHQGRNRIETAH